MGRPLQRLKRRAEFLKVAAAGRKWVAPGLILQAMRRAPAGAAPEEGEADPAASGVRIGYTASRKVGIAVVRNRARRRLRAAVDAVMAEAAPGHDFVLIARAGTASRPFPALVEDLRTALRRLGVLQGAAPGKEARGC